MLQESLGGSGESVASTKKALAQAQKLLQLASVRPNALTLREFRDALEECLKPEGNLTMKIVGFQLASIAPKCTTHDVWKFVLEAVVSELGTSENTSTLAAALSVLRKVPMPLMLGFLLSPEKDPTNKLRALLTHDDVGILCCAIETLSKLMLDVAVNVAEDGLFVFPFESHEARICCQQDLETMVNDTWKLIFHTLSVDLLSKSMLSATGAAFAALTSLFARSSTLAPFYTSIKESIRVQAPLDDVASMIYKQAFPRIRVLITVARSLTIKQQPDAMLWIAMLLYKMMECSGARCPSVSVPYVEIDSEGSNGDDANDDDEPQAFIEPVRVDDLVSHLLESWAFPTVSRRVPLVQAMSLCRAIFILLAHPLQTFTRMRWAAQLAHYLIAQCYFANKSSSNNSEESSKKLKLELSVMLVKTFAWLSSVNCQSLFVRTAEVLYLLDQEQDRRGLIQSLLDTIASHVLINRDFQLLQGLCSMPFFRQTKGFSRLSPRTNGSEVFRALFQALFKAPESPSKLVEHQISQLIALRMFRGLLLLHFNEIATSSPKAHHRSSEISENTVFYIGLLVSHFQGILDRPELALRESLDFFQLELFPTIDKIASQCGRLQILWIGVRLHRTYASHVPFEALVRELQCETGRLFTTMWNHDEKEAATFDSGLMGGDESSTSHQHAGDVNNLDALMILGDCIVLLAQLHPHTTPQFLQMCEKMTAALLASESGSILISQQCRIIEDVMAILSTDFGVDAILEPEGHVSRELFDPRDVFLPLRNFDCIHGSKLEESREPLTVTGCADPVSVRIAHYHMLLDKEDVVTLDIRCCNLTTWALNDLEIHLYPLGSVDVVQCGNATSNLKLRMLRSGDNNSVGTSGGSPSLPPFGVLKAQKQFRVCKFTQAIFLIQVVLVQEPSQDGDPVDGNGAEGTLPTPIHLACSNRYVLPFDTLLRLAQPQFVTASFFRHCWQSAEASVAWQVEAHESKGEQLGVCQHALYVLNTKLAAVFELVVELPMHFHIAMLTQTRWGSDISATLSMYQESTLSWSGILEVRSSRANISEFTKWPRDTVRLFSGDQVHLCNTLAASCESVQPSGLSSDAVDPASLFSVAIPCFGSGNKSSSLSSEQAVATEKRATGEIDLSVTSVTATLTPDVRSTTSVHKDMSIPTDRLNSFARNSRQIEQMRGPEITQTPDKYSSTFL